MCGISGAFHYRGGEPEAGLAERQAGVMRHRGPDDAGSWSEGPAQLGHCRLSIVDLSPGGHQPMANEDGSLRLTFNGELYGWRETRRELESRGHRFAGHSDTEILLHLYEESGAGALRRLRGMFAFALYDRPRRRLLLARDRVGKKPLYYHDDGRRIAFASELKALLLDPGVPREVDDAALVEYLTFQYVPAPRTIWRGVRKLPAGHHLLCDERGVTIEPYWSLPLTPGPDRGAARHRAELRARLEEAVSLRMLADVPVGAFLSGGVDSSAVVALMARSGRAPVKTFTIGFEDADADELAPARRVARHLGTDHHERVVRPDALALLPLLVWGMDEPFADASILPTWHVARMAREHVKVALSGDGGDESFGGYGTYLAARRHRALRWLPGPVRRFLGAQAGRPGADPRLAAKLRRIPMGVHERHLEAMACFPPARLARLLAPGLRAAAAAHDPFLASRALHLEGAREVGEVAALLRLDALTYMTDDVLRKVDGASMLNSLEVRCPLLDQEVLDYVARLPLRYKLRGDVTKWILKESVRDLLPAETLRRGKRGFGVPLQSWFAGGFDRLVRETLLDPRSRGRGWLEVAALEAALASGRPGVAPSAHQLFALVCLELWAQAYVDRAPSAIPLEGAGAPAAARDSGAR